MGKIYLLTNLINSKKYVGQTTTTLELRFARHCDDARKKRCKNRPIYAAMNKYGAENFKMEQLEDVPDELLSEREIFWINELGTFGESGYNSTKGGNGSLLYNHHEILELYQMGYSVKQVAEKVNCSESTVNNVLRAHGLKSRGHSKQVNLFDMQGNHLRTFDSTMDAGKWLIEQGITRNGKARKLIWSCCTHKQKSAYGYKWEYAALPQMME